MSGGNLGELARTLFEESGDALFLFDPASEEVLDANGMAQRLSGSPRAELLRLPLAELFRCDDPAGLERLRQAHRQTEAFHPQGGFWLRQGDAGAWVPVSLTVTRLCTGPRTIGLVTARDLSARRRAEEALRASEAHHRSHLASLEEQLRQAQKMEAVGQLAGGIAHDFNNLLTVILGNLSLLQAALPRGDRSRPLLDAAERAACRAANLTGQLLGFSRRAVLRRELTDVNQTVEEVAELLGRTIDPRISLRTCPAVDLWPVLADPNQLSQVLLNLCLNARDALLPALDGAASAGPPAILLETANVVLPEADEAARAGEHVRLRVRDNGTGIAPEALPHIFEPFFTTKAAGKGTGLGLAMVFGIVQQHRGWVECHSTPGRGACFDIYLPRHLNGERDAWSVAREEERSPRHAPRASRHETVLLADDEPVVRNLGRTILEGHGYRVLTAIDGLDVLDVYRREGGRIDLVVLDLTMPRLAGRDALRQLLALDPGARVLFTSGYSAEHLTEQDHQHTFGFLSKPYRPDDLVRAVRSALDRKRPSGTMKRQGDKVTR